MRITKGKVVGGHIVVEGESLREGATVTILVPDEGAFTLSPEDEASLLEAIAEADRGELLDAQRCADIMNGEVKMPDVAELLRTALSLDVHDRAALAEKLLASLEELNEEEADRLWAEEAQRRLEEYRAGRAAALSASEVAKKAERLFR